MYGNQRFPVLFVPGLQTAVLIYKLPRGSFTKVTACWRAERGARKRARLGDARPNPRVCGDRLLGVGRGRSFSANDSREPSFIIS